MFVARKPRSCSDELDDVREVQQQEHGDSRGGEHPEAESEPRSVRPESRQADAGEGASVEAPPQQEDSPDDEHGDARRHEHPEPEPARRGCVDAEQQHGRFGRRDEADRHDDRGGECPPIAAPLLTAGARSAP